MAEKKKSDRPLPYPTMERPEYEPLSHHRARMQRPGGEQMHRWLRESEREPLYGILSKLFLYPDNQPDWLNSHIPFAMMVASGYAPSGYTVDASHLAGIAPFGIARFRRYQLR